MGDSAKNGNRVMNPWVLHLQKLGLELKCALCLNFFNRPLLLPCDHIFCDSCVPRSAQYGSECHVCKSRCSDADLRPLSFMGNIVTIFKGLDAFSGANLFQHVTPADGRVLEQCPSNEDNSSNDQSVSANKTVQILANPSVGDGKNKGFEMPGRNKNEGVPKRKENPAEQSLVSSPPSFGDNKGSDNDSDPGGDHSPENYPPNKPVKRNFDDMTREQHGSSASKTEGHLKDSKRQKKLNYGPDDLCVKNTGHIQSMALKSESLVPSNSEPQPGLPPPVGDSNPNNYLCGFCQTSRISEATGTMLHYANGIQVVGDEATCSNVVHVHSKCIEWAPQVYYDGDVVQNLKEELLRGSKLKCTRCGLKGAALGCFCKSCRKSYHVPCAVEVSKCRWDTQDYLLLCPTHASLKFPSEKSNKCTSKKETMPMQTIPKQSNICPAPRNKSNKTKEWVLCGSALSLEEKLLLVRFGSMVGATVTKFWRPDVTHVIAATDDKGACTRTLKVLMSISSGSWVLDINWIRASMEAQYPVTEEPYEVRLDNHGCQYGPKNGRLRALAEAPKLFDGLSFYFTGDFMPGYKEDLQSLVVAAGGIILRSEAELFAQHDGADSSKILVVYNLDPPQGSELGDEVMFIWDRLNGAEALATKIGSQVIGHTWLLESIAAYKLQPLLS